MNALNEINKIISNITYNNQMKVSTSSLSTNYYDEEWLTNERMAVYVT